MELSTVITTVLATLAIVASVGAIVFEWQRKRNTERDVEVPCDFHPNKNAESVVFDRFGNELWLCDFCLEVHWAIEKYKKE